jgi:hypothetical protein
MIREVAMSEWDWWRRFKEANATERAYVIVLAVFFALFVVGAFFFDHVAVLVPVLLVIAVVLEQRLRTRKD